jgi:hypothetical protein
MGMRSSEMNLDTLVKQGYPPWAPAPGVHIVDVWHEYDIPTVGTFASEEGRSAVFTLVGEPDDRLTVWAYSCLGEDEANDLERASRRYESTDELDAAIDRMFAGRSVVFALADNLQIWRWSPVEVKAGVLEAATEFLRGVRAALAETTDPGRRFRAELAGVEVETTELVDA